VTEVPASSSEGDRGTRRLSVRRMLTVARVEWIHNRRDVRSLFVILALPVVLLVLYGYGINFDLDKLPFAVFDLDGGEASRDLLQQFVQSRYFWLREVITDQRQIDELIDHGRVVFVLVVPPDLGRTLGSGRSAQVQVVLDGADTTRAQVAIGYIEGALFDYSSRLALQYAVRQGVSAASPFSVHPTILYNADLRSTRFIVPGLIAILLTILSALLTSTCIVREREWGSFESLVTSPAHATEILVGKMIPYVCIAFVDVLASMAAGRFVFGVYPEGSIALLLSAGVLYLLASLAIGVLFSTTARTQQMAILFAMLSTLLPTILLSGFAFPLRSMPVELRVLSNVIPATHFLVIIRGLYLKGAGLAVLWPRLLALFGFAVVLVTIAARRFQKRL
jgi:ABC-2 type transport system permease protein